jgi:protein-disulfide isomerase
MSDALFAAPPEELTPDGCEKIAASLGIPLDGYRACLVDPGIDASIRADTDEFHATKGGGLPAMWIGGTKLEGALGPDAIKEALDAALAHAGS